MSKEKDFDFDIETKEEGDKEAKPPEDEASVLVKLKDKAKEIEKLKKQIATSGSLTAEIIAEARKLAESKKGLEIDTFFKKHELINVDIEQLLHAPLNKEGTYA